MENCFNKTKISGLVSLGLLVAFLMSVLTSPVWAGDLRVAWDKSTKEKGNFVVHCSIVNSSDSMKYFYVRLLDGSGKVAKKWNRQPVLARTTDNYSYPINFANRPAGKYKCQVIDGNNKIVGTFNITHNAAAKLAFVSTKLINKEDGSNNQLFHFQQSSCRGKFLYCEIYDEGGNLVSKPASKNRFRSTRDSGSFDMTWGFYPPNGLRCKSGRYTVKYWVEGSTPKQEELYLEIPEG